jgi:TM2 domain-containing membrane protein YozV
MQGNMPPYGQNNPPGPYYQQPGGYSQPYGQQQPGYPQQQGYGPPQPMGYPQPMQDAGYGVHPVLGIPYSDKSKVAAGVLQIFLGCFGVGRFYTGHTGLAVAQLITCLLVGFVGGFVTCGITTPVFLWPLIDGIVLLATDSRDAEGRMLR